MVFAAELALTPDERQKGLSGRDGLEPQTGMLFLSRLSLPPTIWMKEMRFPLDLVWISQDCTIAEITPDVPVPKLGTPATEIPRYTAGPPDAHTFEINAGEAETHGIGVGDPVRFVGIGAETGGACR